MAGGIAIWVISYFTLFWAAGTACGLSMLQTPHCWPRVNAVTALAAMFNIANYSPIVLAGSLFILIASMLSSAIIYCWVNGFRGRRLHTLTLALSALTALTILSAAGTASSMGGVDSALMNLGAGMPVAIIGLVLAWLALTGLYWL